MELGVLKGSAGSVNDAELIKDTTTAGFVKDVIEASRSVPVIVDFWAAWCGPCKQLTPLLEKIVKSYGGKVRLVKLNVDEHPAIAGQLRIQSLPTVYAFRDGRPLDGFVGGQPESTIVSFTVEGIHAHDLAKSLWTVADQARDEPGRPARSAAQIEHALAGTKIHVTERLLSDIEMVILHLLAFTGFGPAIEFLLQIFVGSVGLFGHRCNP